MRKPLEGKNIMIIGAGVGGLSMGILLRNLGYHVTLVEKNQLPGGLMRSYIRRGIDCPVGVHYVGALGPDEPLGKMFHVLGISVKDLFFPMGEGGVIDRYLFDDFVFDLPVGIDAYETNLKKTFPGEEDALTALMKSLREIAGSMKGSSFLLHPADPFQNMDYFRPMGELLDELRVSARLRAVLAVPCQLIGVPLCDCPVIFHHMVTSVYLFSSWRLKEGGSRMADAFTKRFSEEGGHLLVNSAVREICLHAGQVSGVILETGEKIPADAVVAAIHPKILLGLLPQNALRASLRERIFTLEETDGVLAVQASLDADVHEEFSYNLYRLHYDSRGEIEDGIFYQMRETGDPSTRLLSIITRSPYRDWSSWEHTVSGKRSTMYYEKKLLSAYDLLKKAEAIYGPLKNFRILDVFTPLTLRDYMNCPEGSCYGVKRSARQLLKIASLNHLPIGGLYLAGQNALAPGVMGAMLSSFYAVRQMIGEQRFAAEFERKL